MQQILQMFGKDRLWITCLLYTSTNALESYVKDFAGVYHAWENTDRDLGHYERFIDESLTKNANVTTGKVYWSVLQKERRGDFGGGTVQVLSLIHIYRYMLHISLLC